MLKFTFVALATIVGISSAQAKVKHHELSISCPKLNHDQYKICSGNQRKNCYQVTVHSDKAYATLAINITQPIYHWLQWWNLRNTEIGQFGGTLIDGRIKPTGSVRLKDIELKGREVDRYGSPKCTYTFTFEGLEQEDFDVTASYLEHSPFSLDHCSRGNDFECRINEKVSK